MIIANNNQVYSLIFTIFLIIEKFTYFSNGLSISNCRRSSLTCTTCISGTGTHFPWPWPLTKNKLSVSSSVTK